MCPVHRVLLMVALMVALMAALMAALLAAAPAALAAPAPMPRQLVRSYSMPPARFDDFAGEFDLAHGHLLTVHARGRRYFAALDGGADHEIVPLGAHSFASTDGRMRLDFVQYPNGSVPAVTLRLLR